MVCDIAVPGKGTRTGPKNGAALKLALLNPWTVHRREKPSIRGEEYYGRQQRVVTRQKNLESCLGVCAVENDVIIGGQEPRERGRRHFAPPDQLLLLAPDVRDWLPEGHFAHHVSDLVDGLDLRAAPYEGDGRRNAPYEPRMMVKVLLYGYATGVFSSRGMARKLEEDVAFRVLGAGNFPSHRTLCEFRRRHLEEFKGLFVEVVRLARETGLLSFGKLSIDGTKVRANASKRKAMSYGRMRAEERAAQREADDARGRRGSAGVGSHALAGNPKTRATSPTRTAPS